MSYSLHKLKFFIDDSDNWLRRNKDAADAFFLAEDDVEKKELTSLMHPEVHYSSFWGVARGHRAGLAVLGQEQTRLRLSWSTTSSIPITSHIFVRDGYVQLMEGGLWNGIPFVGSFLSFLNQKAVRESLVVRDGRVVFRDLGYRWGMSVY